MVALKVITSENPCRRMEIACCHSLWKSPTNHSSPKQTKKNTHKMDFPNEQVKNICKFVILCKTSLLISCLRICFSTGTDGRIFAFQILRLRILLCEELQKDWPRFFVLRCSSEAIIGNEVQYLTKNQKCHKKVQKTCSNFDLHSKSWCQMNSDWLYSCCCRHSPHGISCFLRGGDSSASADFL